MPRGYSIYQRPNGQWKGQYNLPVEPGERHCKRKHFQHANREQVVTWLLASGVALDDVDPSEPQAHISAKEVVSGSNWRDWNKWIALGQGLRRQSSLDNTAISIHFDVEDPICVLALSDTHIGSWASDHGLFERITDEIIHTPGLYVALVGDIQEMAIKLRGVLEVSGNILPPELQHQYVESWLGEIAHKVLFSTWDNHSVERAEVAAGHSPYAELMKRRVPWFNGIGHCDLIVGSETYKLAVSHRFAGSSLDHPCHGGIRYLLREGRDREVAMAGDSHRPGIESVPMHAGSDDPRIAINTGTLNLQSGYARRYFSLQSHPVFPCLEFFPDRHIINPYWSVASWRASRGALALP